MSAITGFRMGDHQFVGPDDDDPPNRFEKKGGPIRGAIPPTYLADRAKEPDPKGPAALLVDGKFCGHGEPTYGVFDIRTGSTDLFEIRMTGFDKDGMIVSPPFIEARADGSTEWFPIYDTRKHPAGVFRWSGEMDKLHIRFMDVVKDPKLADKLPIPKLDTIYSNPRSADTLFKIAVGYEYAVDCSSENDISWFALAVQSLDGEVLEIIFDDETA